MKVLLIIFTLMLAVGCSNEAFEPQKDIERLTGVWVGERETTEDIYCDTVNITSTHIRFYATGKETAHVVTYIDNEYVLTREKIITLEKTPGCKCMHAHGGTVTYSFDKKYLNFSFTGNLKKAE